MSDYLQAIFSGLGNLASLSGFALVLGGTLLAMLMSFLPGIGTASLLTLVMLLTLSWSQTSVLLLFGALVGGATFMGSVTAILFNVPGSAPNAATLLDGYPLSQRGFTHTAIAAAATASGLGSVIGVVVLLCVIPFLSRLVPSLGPLEQLLLGVWGLATIVALPSSSKPKAALMCMLGLLAAMVGNDPVAAQPRWFFGIDGMVSGLGIVPVLLGLFTFAEILSWRDRRISHSQQCAMDPLDSTGAGIKAVFSRPWLTLKSSVIGTLIGIIPGIGGTVAGFVAYGQAQASASDNTEFGRGDIRGVIAPEAATDAKDGGSLVPAIALGLPGSEVGVFLIAVLAIHGLVPGEPMLNGQLPLTMTLIFALLFSNLLTSAIGIGLAPSLAQLSSIPLHRATLPVLVISLLLIAQLNGLMFDLATAVVFGIIGYGCKRFDWPRVPLVIAFVLGEFIERNLALSTRLIELGRIEPLQRPVAVIIVGLILLSLILPRRNAQQSRGNWHSHDSLICALILLLNLLLLGTALLGSYSVYASSIAFAASLFSAVLLFVSRGREVSDTPRSTGRSNKQVLGQIFVFGLFPIIAWLTGFVPAMGLLVFAFLRGDRESAGETGFRAIGWSLLVMLFCFLVIEQVWQLQLSDAVLLTLLT